MVIIIHHSWTQAQAIFSHFKLTHHSDKMGPKNSDKLDPDDL